MKNEKTVLVDRFTVRLDAFSAKALHQSGQKPSDWLRQAAADRIEKEQALETTKSPVEIQLASLKREVESLKDSAREIQKEMLRHRRDQTALASDLTALKDLQERLKTQQETLNRAQLQLSDELGEGLSALGASLIAGLRDLLETFAASRAEPKTPTLPPPLPRRRL